MHDESWLKIYRDYRMDLHDFNRSPYEITATQIKKACHDFLETSQKEVRILCKQDNREKRPQIFKDNGLFLLPIKNGKYVIVKGEGYVDIPEINSTEEEYKSKLNFKLDTSLVGDSEMQHLDFAYASSLIRTFMGDDSLVLTIRGRKYTPSFSFKVGKHVVDVSSVQTEVDAGYEGENQVVLVEAKNSGIDNVIIRQLYYPFKQWQNHTKKSVITLFFEKRGNIYLIWRFKFNNVDDYNSIELTKANKYIINDK